jgi:hypothetical protein
MNADPLKVFRRQGIERHTEPTAPAQSRRAPYQAFTTKEKLGRVEIRMKDGFSHAPGHSFILDVYYEHAEQTGILLVTSFATIKILGRNLLPVAQALQRHQCQTLVEFNPTEYDAPADASAPYIESITVQSGRS